MKNLAEQMAANEYWQGPPDTPEQRVSFLHGMIDTFVYDSVRGNITRKYDALAEQDAAEQVITEGEPLQLDVPGALLKVVQDMRMPLKNTDPTFYRAANFDGRAQWMIASPLYKGEMISAMADGPDGLFVVARRVLYMQPSLTRRQFTGVQSDYLKGGRPPESVGKVLVGSVGRQLMSRKAGMMDVRFSHAGIIHPTTPKREQLPEAAHEPSFVRGVIPGATTHTTR